MGRKKTVVGDRVKKNQELRLKAPFLTVPEAMLAYGLKSRFFTFWYLPISLKSCFYIFVRRENKMSTCILRPVQAVLIIHSAYLPDL